MGGARLLRPRPQSAGLRAGSGGGWFSDHAGRIAGPAGGGALYGGGDCGDCVWAPETVVDGNVERVVSRLFAVETPLPAAKPELVALAEKLTPVQRPGDFAQAMMDLGATICTPRKPACAICPLSDLCAARAKGIAADLPRKLAKPPKPQREGIAWVAMNEDAILLERRAPKGLLGGTLAFPSTGWDGSAFDAPLSADWQDLPPVQHTFTHFALNLQVRAAHISGNPERGFWMPRAEFNASDLPGLMRKVWDRVG